MCSNPSPCQTKWLWNSQSPETTAAATAAHRTYPSSPAAATLQEKHKVSCPGFLPNPSPMQHSCSHYKCFASFCSSTCAFMQPLQRDLHPRVAEHQGGTDSTPKRSQPQPPCTGPALHRWLQPLYTEKHKVSCSGFLPKTEPLQHHAPLPFMVASSLPRHSPSSSLPFLSTSLRHHFPSSPLPFVTTPLHHHFLKVNFIASYSFVMYWYIMYCYRIYHPSS